MTSDLGFKTTKRFYIIAALSLLVMVIVNRALYQFRTKENKLSKILEVSKGHKILSNDLHSILHGVEYDLNYFERTLLAITKLPSPKREASQELQALLGFLETHPGYFKVRLVNSDGDEIFKVLDDRSRRTYYTSRDLFKLEKQVYYKKLSSVLPGDYFFSGMEWNIINGVLETPKRPTVRVAKKIKLHDGAIAHLVINLDGERINEIFDSIGLSQSLPKVNLVNQDGELISSFPVSHNTDLDLPISLYSVESPFFRTLLKQSALQGGFESNGELVVFSQFKLPNSKQKWFLLTNLARQEWAEKAWKELLGWIFWEVLFLSLFLTWLWRDEKKQYEDRVVNVLLKERTEFIQNVSHQLKTPLAIMVNTLETKSPSVEDWKGFKGELRGLIKIVEDLLLLAHVDSMSSLPLKPELLMDVIDQAIDSVGRKAQAHGVRIAFNILEAPGITGDYFERLIMADLFRSALINLLDNAIDFSPPDGVVTVTLKVVSEHVEIIVEDQGPGIPDEFRAKMFERYARHNRERSGSGLGLAITKKIVDLHKGSIRYEPTDRGARFVIVL